MAIPRALGCVFGLRGGEVIDIMTCWDHQDLSGEEAKSVGGSVEAHTEPVAPNERQWCLQRVGPLGVMRMVNPVRRRSQGKLPIGGCQVLAPRFTVVITQSMKFSGDFQVILHSMVTGAVKATDRVVVEAAALIFAASGFVGLAHSEAYAGAQVLVGTLE